MTKTYVSCHLEPVTQSPDLNNYQLMISCAIYGPTSSMTCSWICVWVCVHVQATVYILRSEDNLAKLVLSFHFCLGSRDQTQTTRLKQNMNYTLCHLAVALPLMALKQMRTIVSSTSIPDEVRCGIFHMWVVYWYQKLLEFTALRILSFCFN